MTYTAELQQLCYAALKAEYADLSEGQLRRLAAKIAALDDFKMCRNSRIAMPAADEVILIAQHLARSEPELLRTVPSADDVLNHLADEAAKAGTPMMGEAKLAAFRKVQAMGPEERLAAMPFQAQQEQRPAADNTAKDQSPPRPWKSPSDVTLDDLHARWPNIDLDAKTAQTRLTMARTLFDERRMGSREDRELSAINSKDQSTLSAADRITQHRLQNPAERKAPRYSS